MKSDYAYFFLLPFGPGILRLICSDVSHSISLLYSFLLCEYIIVYLLSVFNCYNSSLLGTLMESLPVEHVQEFSRVYNLNGIIGP